MRRIARLLATAIVAALCGVPAAADDAPAPFDYWVLSLSWSPEYCRINISDVECRDRYTFTVHGLSPQNDIGGGPTKCGSRERLPQDLIDRLQPMMPSWNMMQHEWNVHGNCSGLDQQAYFELLERARRKLEIPDAYGSAEERITTSRSALLQAFRSTNPGFENADFALSCNGHWLREVQVCMDKDLEPRRCGAKLDDDCGDTIKLRPQR